MKTTFAINTTSRKTLLNYLENYTLEQLNEIPKGYSNNIIWNIGHIIVVQQMLVYNLSSLSMMVTDEMVASYKKGTKPEKWVTKDEIDAMKLLLFSTIEQTANDFNQNIFQNYKPFTTMSGFEVTSAAAAIEFNNYHEAIHAGIIMQIKKFI